MVKDTEFVKDLQKRTNVFHKKVELGEKEKEEEENRKKKEKEQKRLNDEEEEARSFVQRVIPQIQKAADEGKDHYHALEVPGGIGSSITDRYYQLVEKEFEKLGLRTGFNTVKDIAKGSGRESDDADYITVYWSTQEE